MTVNIIVVSRRKRTISVRKGCSTHQPNRSFFFFAFFLFRSQEPVIPLVIRYGMSRLFVQVKRERAIVSPNEIE